MLEKGRRATQRAWPFPTQSVLTWHFAVCHPGAPPRSAVSGSLRSSDGPRGPARGFSADGRDPCNQRVCPISPRHSIRAGSLSGPNARPPCPRWSRFVRLPDARSPTWAWPPRRRAMPRGARIRAVRHKHHLLKAAAGDWESGSPRLNEQTAPLPSWTLARAAVGHTTFPCRYDMLPLF